MEGNQCLNKDIKKSQITLYNSNQILDKMVEESSFF